jgi:hypothetical protein
VSKFLRSYEKLKEGIPRATFQDNKTIINIIIGLNLTDQQFAHQIEGTTLIEKYRAKTEKAIGLRFILENGVLEFKKGHYIECLWQHDPLVDDYIAQQRSKPVQLD